MNDPLHRNREHPTDAEGSVAARGLDRQAGFSLVEIIVALAIMVMMATVLTESAVGYIDRTRQQEGTNELQAIDAAITKFKTNTTRNPGRLKHLAVPITTSDTSICTPPTAGAVYSAGNASAWAGPYISRISTPTGGLRVFVGKARDKLVRSVIGTGEYVSLYVDSVRQEDAEAVNGVIDPDTSSTTGTIRWTQMTSPSNGFVVLEWYRSGGSATGC